MVFSDAQAVGKIMGVTAKSQEEYKQDFIEVDETADFTILAIDSVSVTGSYFIYTKTLDGSTFTIGHPVQGIIGSNYLGVNNVSSSGLFSSGLL